MRATICGVFFVLASAICVQTTNAQPTAPQGAPGFEEIHKQLVKQLWAASYGEKKTYKYQSLKFGTPKRVGSTVFYPVFVECHVTTHFPDRVSRTQRKHQIFEFFKDEYGFWGYHWVRNLEGHDDILSTVRN